MLDTPEQVLARARDLDAADPLAHTRDLFIPAEPGVRAYLDGNSLGRPLRATQRRINHLIEGAWATRLIRSWDEQWMDLPFTLGDQLGRVCLGAAPGQTAIGDSTTVLIYKALRAAVDYAAQQGRREIILDSENFPTDRFIAEGVAAETGAELTWLHPDPAEGVTLEQVQSALTDRTGVVLLSHVAYKSAWIADLPGITAAAHRAGALIIWDLCHAAGSVPVDLDRNQVDLALGCTYKFLNGGPGSPAFLYVADHLQPVLTQPIQGWMGAADVFAMGPHYQPAHGIRRFISGTPPVLGMIGIADTLELIATTGLDTLRTKAITLGQFAIDVTDGLLSRHAVQVAAPRNPDQRGGHVTITHPDAHTLCTALCQDHYIPDFRNPNGIRLGLAPLTTSYQELAETLIRIDQLLS